MSIMLITHDLGVIAETAHRVVVMYAGVVAEVGTVEQVFGGPNHPYTEGLKAAIPKLGERIERLHTIPGSVPSPYEEIVGCPFHHAAEQRWSGFDVGPIAFPFGAESMPRDQRRPSLYRAEPPIVDTDFVR